MEDIQLFLRVCAFCLHIFSILVLGRLLIWTLYKSSGAWTRHKFLVTATTVSMIIAQVVHFAFRVSQYSNSSSVSVILIVWIFTLFYFLGLSFCIMAVLYRFERFSGIMSQFTKFTQWRRPLMITVGVLTLVAYTGIILSYYQEQINLKFDIASFMVIPYMLIIVLIDYGVNVTLMRSTLEKTSEIDDPLEYANYYSKLKRNVVTCFTILLTMDAVCIVLYCGANLIWHSVSRECIHAIVNWPAIHIWLSLSLLRMFSKDVQRRHKKNVYTPNRHREPTN